MPVSLAVAMEIYRESMTSSSSSSLLLHDSGVGAAGAGAGAGSSSSGGSGGVIGGVGSALGIGGMGVHDSAVGVSASQAWAALSDWLMKQFQVKAFPPNNINSIGNIGNGAGGGIGGVASMDHQQQVGMVVLFGDQSNVDQSKNALAQWAETHRRRVARAQTSAAERLRARQGAGLTYDWRVLGLSSTNVNASGSGSGYGNNQSGNSSGYGYGSGYNNNNYNNNDANVLSVDLLLRQVTLMSSSPTMMGARGWPLPQELLATAGATTTLTYDRKSALACLAFTNSQSNSTSHSAHRLVRSDYIHSSC